MPADPEGRSKRFIKPERDRSLPLWVIPDTKDKLKGLLHVLRRFDLCRDIIILTAHDSPKQYLSYLTERNYTHHAAGKKQVDSGEAIALLAREYKARKILTDAGKTLNGILLDSGFVDEISLLVHPIIVGKRQDALLGEAAINIGLRLMKNEIIGKDQVWLVYKVLNSIGEVDT